MALVDFDSVDMTNTKSTTEEGDLCGESMESEESIQARSERSLDQINVIQMILHYRNHSSDAEKLRQIRVVVE